MLQAGLQIIAIHILTNISRSKDYHVMKFVHLIEYNMRKVFLEISYTKYVGDTIPRPLSKKSKLWLSVDQ